uniref:Mediator of RNA polymerase II transcription subunit 7 n=1 Tax=Lynceus sp. MCZ IZ 141354 TaxID=1930659 RepID=A0A9N6WRL2_9CRUS|nr:EOG090X0EJA [Lynceus sp. MCZ IZ 141354]
MTETTQVSSYPAPPMQYVNLYSDENVKRGRALKPPPPITDSYSMFGIQFHADDAVIRPLESQGIRRLYPNNYDHKRELKKLNHSILTSFLDLVDILIRCPESPRRGEKIEDLTLLFIHMHHLVNEFRPHQARETLRVMLELQKRQRLETAERFQRHLERAMEIARQAIESLPHEAQLEQDEKLLLESEQISAEGKSQTTTTDVSYLSDQLMCGIIDSM